MCVCGCVCVYVCGCVCGCVSVCKCVYVRVSDLDRYVWVYAVSS